MDDSPQVALDAPRRPLGELNYRIAFRVDGWVDCLVLRDAERWVGRGASEAEALDDALAQMFASGASRELLAQYAAMGRAKVAERAAETAAPPEPEVSAAPAPAIEPPPPPAVEQETWADGAALEPAPRDPAALFAQTVAEVDAIRTPAEAEIDAHADTLVRLAQQLRWVRCSGIDAGAWTAALDRLRTLAEEVGPRGAAVARVLGPRNRPPMPWALLITGVNGADEKRVAMDALRASLVEADDDEALLSWLTHAGEVFTTRELAKLVEPVRGRIAGLETAAAAVPDRRARRKMRDLVKRLAAGGPASAR